MPDVWWSADPKKQDTPGFGKRCIYRCWHRHFIVELQILAIGFFSLDDFHLSRCVELVCQRTLVQAMQIRSIQIFEMNFSLL
jgi:hypothetical protein